MRLLLDTHIYLWCVNDDKLLTKRAKKLITEAEEVYVSSASIWEAAIKVRINKLDVNIPALVSAIEKTGFQELPILVRHTAMVAELPDYHRDPFDRILIAQAMSEPLRFLTADSLLTQYSALVDVI